MERGRCLPYAEQESKSLLLLTSPGTLRCRKEPLDNKYSHINEEVALRELLTVNKVTGQRYLGTLA
jgi:hypothetical protein